MLKPVILDDNGQYDFRAMDRDLDRTKSAVFMGKGAAFFGPLMCTLDFVWAGGDVETAATDYKHFFWNPDDFLRCRKDNRGEDRSTVMHELWHNARLHGLRVGNRCHDIWNIACDIWINRELRKAGYHVPTTGKSAWIDRPDLDHIELEEEIYEYLISPGGGNMKPGQVPGSAMGPCKHGHVIMTPQLKQAALNANVKAVQAAKMSKQAGDIPGGVESLLNGFLKPKVPWKSVLYRFFNDLLDEDFSWARPNRRYTHMYLPSRFEDEGRLEHLTWYMDVSGSVSDRDAHRMASEVHYLWTVFKPKKLSIVLFDTKIQDTFEFNEDDKFDKLKITGRGGTCFKCVRQHIIDTKPTAAIIMSDMYVAPMQPHPKLPPIIWIAVNADVKTVPFGTLIHIKE